MSIPIQNTLLGQLIGEYQDEGMQEYLLREAGYTTQISPVWPDGQTVNPYAQANAAMYWPKEFIERESEFPLHLREYLADLGKAMGHYMITGLVEYEPLQLSLDGKSVIRSETMMAFHLIANAERRTDRNQAEIFANITQNNETVSAEIAKQRRVQRLLERTSLMACTLTVAGIYLSRGNISGGLLMTGLLSTWGLFLGAGTRANKASAEEAKLQKIPDDIRDIDEPYEKAVREHLARLQANTETA